MENWMIQTQYLVYILKDMHGLLILHIEIWQKILKIVKNFLVTFCFKQFSIMKFRYKASLTQSLITIREKKWKHYCDNSTQIVNKKVH